MRIVVSCLCAVGVGTGLALLAGQPARPAGEIAGVPAATEGAQSASVFFERNEGQTDAAVRFVHRAPGGLLYLTADGSTTVLAESAPSDAGPCAPGSYRAIRMRFDGGRADAPVVGERRLASYSNYLVGNDASAWRPRVPHFAQTRHREVYPGIDVVHHGGNGFLEYDFEVAPGADPGRIALSFEGVDHVDVDARGDLVLRAGDREIRHGRPVVFQDGPHGRTAIDGRFVLDGESRARLELAEYDRSLALVIDPPLSYASYLGGSAIDQVRSIEVDGSNVVVFASSTSLDFPVTAGVLKETGDVANDISILKFDSTGASLVFATFFGGERSEAANAAAVSSDGYYAFAGTVLNSTSFPEVGAIQNGFGGGTIDAFVAAVSDDGTAIVFSTYLGGAGDDVAFDIETDAPAIYVSGRAGDGFPTTVGAFQTANGGNGLPDAFVVKISSDGRTVLSWSTLVGGSGTETVFLAASIYVDGVGQVTLCSDTDSSDYPFTAGAFQTALAANVDGCVTRLSADGSSLVFSTYLGGTGTESLTAIGPGGLGSIWVAGRTGSDDMPTVAPFQAQRGGVIDGWIGRLDFAGATLLGGSYLGGSSTDEPRALVADAAGNAYVFGYTFSSDFPSVDPFQVAHGGGRDAFVTLVRSDGTIGYSSVYGGTGLEDTTSFDTLAVTSAGEAWFGGQTTSTDLPVAGGPFHATSQGGSDGFFARVGAAAEGPDPVGDSSLLLTRAAFNVNHGRHAKGKVKDSIVLKGCLNPNGASDDLAGATIALSVNGEVVLAPVTLDAKGRSRSAKGAAPSHRALFRSRDGAFSILVKSADLRIPIPLADATADGTTTLSVQVTVANAGLGIETVTGDLVFDYRSRQGKTARGKYAFAKSVTDTDVYKATRTIVKESGDGAHSVSLTGALTQAGGASIVPTGDVTLTIGDATPLVIPFASLRISGSEGAETVSYSRNRGEVAGLRRLAITNRRRSVRVQTDALSGTGIPPAGGGETTAHAIPIRIEIVTGSGTLAFGSTVELRRSRDTSPRWLR